MRGVTRMPRIPPDVRLAELAFEGCEQWFTRHVRESLTCYCGHVEADPLCDRGVALFRLSVAAKAGKLDKRDGGA